MCKKRASFRPYEVFPLSESYMEWVYNLKIIQYYVCMYGSIQGVLNKTVE